jgi:hypothetical protein
LYVDLGFLPQGKIRQVNLTFLLVLFPPLVKLTPTMKRLFTLIVLLGMLGVFAGCSNSDSGTGGGGATNAAPAAPSTNK